MKILHVSDDISSVKGGVSSAIKALCEISLKCDLSISVIHTSNEHYDLPEQTIDLCCPPSRVMNFWKFSFFLYYTLKKEISKLDPEKSIIHVHGVWNAPQYFAIKLAIKYKIPFIVSFYGMLLPWLWINQGLINRIKKTLYWKLFLNNKLKYASKYHAITDDEKHIIEKYLPNKTSIAVVNNFVINNYENKIKHDSIDLNHSILFLGRIHKIKGIELLINGFIEADLPKKWKLIIYGLSENKNYEEYLKIYVNKINCRNLRDRIIFSNPIYGEEKFRLLSQSWVLVAPSYSEAMGLVNLEAATVSLPSITTNNVGLKNWEEGGGMLVNPNVKEIRDALIRACSWPKDVRILKGIKSREFYENNYSQEKTAKKWANVYESMIKRN
ncbi:glycosyltransferase [Alphaproteobacteria bacterium]|nr:glycosyltransferase [Alphaproteobacteria bacterium]